MEIKKCNKETEINVFNDIKGQPEGIKITDISSEEELEIKEYLEFFHTIN